MRNICDFIDGELKELDRKAGSGKLSLQEIEYAERLSRVKKNLLTIEAMEDSGSYGARGRDGRYADNRYIYDPNRYMDDGMRMDGNRYSRSYRDNGDMISELEELKRMAPNEQVRRRYESFLSDVKNMM
jgi:hypothetical protein